MKSKTTISRENKKELLLHIHNRVMQLLVIKKEKLSLINGWELKELSKKIDNWFNEIYGKQEVIKNQ